MVLICFILVSLLILNRSQIGGAWVFYFSVVNNKATVLIHLEIKEGWGGMEGMFFAPTDGKNTVEKVVWDGGTSNELRRDGFGFSGDGEMRRIGIKVGHGGGVGWGCPTARRCRGDRNGAQR